MSGSFQEQFAAAEQGIALANVEAEIGLLGDLINDNRLIDLIADRLRGRDFSVPLYGRVFDQMLDQSATGANVDAVTLAPHFGEDLEWPRTFAVLSAASLNAGSRPRTKAYFEQITMLSSRRRMVAGLQDVVHSARDLSVTREELLANADEAVAELAEEVVTTQAPVGTYAQAVIDSFGQPIVGVRCGMIGSLDDAIGVLRPANLVVVGGRPGMGKTSLVTSYSIGAASRGHGVLIFSLEMSADELTRRMLADMTFTAKGGVPYEDVRDGTVRGHDLAAVIDAKHRFDALPLEINETSGLTLSKLIRQARTHKRRLAAKGEKLELVVVDYLQLMAHSRKGMSPYEHASEVSIGLKTFAKAEGLTVMAVAQLSREVEKRPDKRPMPSDLRDSGQIEQDADVILFVYREEEYLRRSEPEDQFGGKYEAWRTDMEAVRNKIEFLVPKRRSGPTGKAVGWFFGANSAVRGSEFYSNPEAR
ncbi:replicative DNA helicase [Sphingomonas sp. CV7422]|uniref:replicative DNA helicase n=1 Tax=Sphingomonas sp. CV7422 TaxID=3018036 RepID=UPI0022FE256D|nr:DnaB-like helicase C-terminal domain-containing protein [Sphingomonas sp. CV7422]